MSKDAERYSLCLQCLQEKFRPYCPSIVCLEIIEKIERDERWCNLVTRYVQENSMRPVRKNWKKPWEAQEWFWVGCNIPEKEPREVCHRCPYLAEHVALEQEEVYEN